MQIELHPNKIPEDLKKYFRPKRKYGPFILRNVIVWKKPNSMPSSAKDRFTVDFEYLFFFTKNKSYFFETQYEPHQYESIRRACRGRHSSKLDSGQYSTSYKCDFIGYDDIDGKLARGELRGVGKYGRNKRCVWSIPTKPFPDSHFAVFPEQLIETPIKAGCPEFICAVCGQPKKKNYSETRVDTRPGLNTGSGKCGSDLDPNKSLHESDLSKFRQEIVREETGFVSCNCNKGFKKGIVLDPFIGSGTTAVVALKQNKQFIGFEVNPEYIKIAEKRIKPYIEQMLLVNYL